MRFRTCLTPALLIAASLSLAPGCASRERPTPIYPDPADLRVEAKPLLTPEAVNSEADLDAHDIALEAWGDRGWLAVGRLCRWAAGLGAEGLECPEAEPEPPRRPDPG